MSAIVKNQSPSRGDVHINRPLTNISVAYMPQDGSAFVADRVFPTIGVQKQSDSYFVYDKGDFHRHEMRERAPGTESAGSGYKVDTETYNCRVYAFHKDIHEQVRANQDNPLNQDREATEFVTHKARLQREKNWASTYFKSGVFSFNADGANAATAANALDLTDNANNNMVWWNDANSNPIEDIRRSRRIVQEETGFKPNKLVLGPQVYDTLVDHPDIIGRLDRGQTSGPAMAKKEALAALFELDEILVMEAIENRGGFEEDDDFQFIGGKHALLCYAAPRPGLMTPSAGYTFNWQGLIGAGGTNGISGTRISKWWMQNIKADRVEIEAAFDQKLIGQDLGVFFNGIVQ